MVAVDLQKASSRAAAAVAADNAAQPSEHEQQLMFSLSSQVEDGMLEAARQMEAGFDRAFGAISSRVHMIDAAQASSEQVSNVASQALGWLLLWQVHWLLSASAATLCCLVGLSTCCVSSVTLPICSTLASDY